MGPNGVTWLIFPEVTERESILNTYLQFGFHEIKGKSIEGNYGYIEVVT